MQLEEKALGWTFDNGQEFPGAKGGLETDAAEKHNGQASLKLVGDFTGGGNYVQASTKIPDIDVHELAFWLKNQQANQLTVRLIDAQGRCHQFNLKTEVNEGWQRITFPLEQYFSKQGTSAAVTSVAKYEAWGGPKEGSGEWHGPAKLIAILIGKPGGKNAVNTIWLNDVSIIPRVAGTKVAAVASEARLDEVIDGEHSWDFVDGREFPGAKGGVDVVDGNIRLTGDFTGGGAYVGGLKNLEDLGFESLSEIRLKVKADNVKEFGVRLGDSTGQTHQKNGWKVPGDGQWHEVVLKPGDFAGSEHWGGANDGKWHGAAKYVCFNIGKGSTGGGQGSLLFQNVVAKGTVPGKTGGIAYQVNFENGLEGWSGQAQIAAEGFKGKQSLVLEKTQATLRSEVSASGPSFAVSGGALDVSFATRTELESMDASYNGFLSLSFLNAGGGVVKNVELAAPFRKSAWKPQNKRVEIPTGATQARFEARINKESPGKFWIDELAALPLVADRDEEVIKRLQFSTAAIGNLLFPTDPREVKLEVLTLKPLPEADRTVYLSVRDYWGAEQSEPIKVTLSKAPKQDKYLVYAGSADLKDLPLEIGRYYELYGEIPREGGHPFTNFSSFAILPEAVTNQYAPMDVPFTSRNWDNRLEPYVRLTHRLGIRVVGVWGRMHPDPAKVEAPFIEMAQELGMGVLTGSPAHSIEQRSKGYEKMDEAWLRKAVQNFMAKYGHVKPLIVNLGNEPHAKGDETLKDVEAYRVVYDEIKKIDPSVYVVGTSVGTTEEAYFKNGFGKYCDAYDFHVYESAANVRNAVAVSYPAMFKKYGEAKPVWSTEVGLNSQGMARIAVASEVYRKFANFFAGGGANVSWFGLLYPDKEGTEHESSGSAHNVFDSRYNRYAPKLDAVAYYNAVNAIAIKKYVEDKVYDEASGLQAFLFTDREKASMQLWYTNKGRKDVFIPLAGVNEVQVIRLDGTRAELDAEGKGLTLTVTEDPLVLLYKNGPAKLPGELGQPVMVLAKIPDMLIRGAVTDFQVDLGDGVSPELVSLKVPFAWKADKAKVADMNALTFALTAPEASAIREADLTVSLKNAAGKITGQLYYRPAVTGSTSMEVLPQPLVEGQAPSVKLVLHNNSTQPQQVSWDLAISGEQSLEKGDFTKTGPSSAYFNETPSGSVELAGGQSKEYVLPLAEADLYKVYHLVANMRDPMGRSMRVERPMAAFYGVPKASAALSMDGSLDEPAWKTAPVRKLDQEPQFYGFQQKERPSPDWTGPADLSADIRYLWDDDFLYVAVQVTDDKTGGLKADDQIWAQDGLQFLIDPVRTSSQKPGKYDYSVAVGKNGPQTWCNLSADGEAPTGNVPAVKVAEKRAGDGTATRTYEIAFPWSRIAPFKPAPGGDLGLTLIVNEDDGNGRDAFMTWFGNAHSKQVDTVGDLILLAPQP